jgi:hypothetical protein
LLCWLGYSPGRASPGPEELLDGSKQFQRFLEEDLALGPGLPDRAGQAPRWGLAGIEEDFHDLYDANGRSGKP